MADNEVLPIVNTQGNSERRISTSVAITVFSVLIRNLSAWRVYRPHAKDVLSISCLYSANLFFHVRVHTFKTPAILWNTCLASGCACWSSGTFQGRNIFVCDLNFAVCLKDAFFNYRLVIWLH